MKYFTFHYYFIMKLFVQIIINCCVVPQFKMKVAQLTIIITLYFKQTESLTCSYIDGDLLGKEQIIDVRSNTTIYINKLETREGGYLINQILPKFCTRLEPVLTLKRLYIQGTKTLELGTDLFQTYELEILEIMYNNITVIFSHTFVNVPLVEIYLRTNLITTIEKGAFKDLKRLELLDLSNNKITFINSGMFINLISLDIFIMTGNLLKVLNTHDLDFLRQKHMTGVYLNMNLIGTLQSKALSKLSLLGLYLQDNQLTDIAGDVFLELCIESIVIQDNNLSVVSKQYLTQICQLQKIYFSSRPFLVDKRKFNVIHIGAAVFILSIILIGIGYFLYNKLYK